MRIAIGTSNTHQNRDEKGADATSVEASIVTSTEPRIDLKALPLSNSNHRLVSSRAMEFWREVHKNKKGGKFK